MADKILNLYAGIGGNRKLWSNCQVTAVENNPSVAALYQGFYPADKIIVGDAHDYLMRIRDDQFDFIWSSPPCPTHSDIRRCGAMGGRCSKQYPDMALYQEIIFLKHMTKNVKWVVENVVPYYDLLIPGVRLDRHIFWANFPIYQKPFENKRIHNNIHGGSVVYGTGLPHGFKNGRKALRNMVNPDVGNYIKNLALDSKKTETKQLSLF